MATSEGVFEIDLVPAEPELDGRANRFTFTKTWSGGIVGTGRGLMLSGGDPQAGEAGYVAVESFEGRVDGRAGSFLLQQSGQMIGGEAQLRYDVVPGSGGGELAGITGTLDLDIVSGEHRVRLAYTLPVEPPR